MKQFICKCNLSVQIVSWPPDLITSAVTLCSSCFHTAGMCSCCLSGFAGVGHTHGLSLTAWLIACGSAVSLSYFIQSHLYAFLLRQCFSERRREGNSVFSGQTSGAPQWRQESPGRKSHAEMSHVKAKHVGFSGVMASASKWDSLGIMCAPLTWRIRVDRNIMLPSKIPLFQESIAHGLHREDNPRCIATHSVKIFVQDGRRFERNIDPAKIKLKR